METHQTQQVAFTVKEFSRLARISLPVLYELIHSKGFPAVRVGKKFLIPVKAGEEWLNNNIGKQLLND